MTARLFSYRRCPYAMRARMALAAANISTDIIEISLRDKPEELIRRSPKATVPILITEDDIVIEQSLDIMLWALHQNDPFGWLSADKQEAECLIAQNDGPFKRALDRYKYPERYPENPMFVYREQGAEILSSLEARMAKNHTDSSFTGTYLLGAQSSIADVAIFPFIRQFAAVDANWFANAPFPLLRTWLDAWLQSKLFVYIMQKDLTRIG